MLGSDVMTFEIPGLENKFSVDLLNFDNLNALWPFALNIIVKIGVGEFGFFQDLKSSDVTRLQQVLCECIKVDGKNIELEDIVTYRKHFALFLGYMLEHNFGTFSNPKAIIKLLTLGVNSESAEKTKKKSK